VDLKLIYTNNKLQVKRFVHSYCQTSYESESSGRKNFNLHYRKAKCSDVVFHGDCALSLGGTWWLPRLRSLLYFS